MVCSVKGWDVVIRSRRVLAMDIVILQGRMCSSELLQDSRKGGRIASKVHVFGGFSALFFQHFMVKLPLSSQGE